MPAETTRLYFEDSRALAFSAVVEAVRRGAQDRIEVRLDRTAFYPEGGGQPCDFGTLGGARVVDVQDEGGAIWHALDEGGALAEGARVDGAVDARRRFDHMQQHSGQHLLSQAFVRALGLDTQSFHLGAESCTIDLACPAIPPAKLSEVEEDCARVLREARPVKVRVDRSDPAKGAYREIEIDGFDLCACGGTHVANTAEIEAIVVRRVDRINDKLCRVEFLCGNRARADHRRKQERLRELVRLLSVEEPKLKDAVEKTLGKLKDADKRQRELEKELLPIRAAKLLEGAEPIGGARLLALRIAPADREGMAPLAQALLRHAGVAVAFTIGEASAAKGQLLCASSLAALPAGDWLKRALAEFGGNGGGSPHLAQGAFADAARADAVLARARDLARESLASVAPGSSP